MPTLAERLAEPDVAGLPDWRAAEVLNTPDPVNGTRRVPIPRQAAWTALLPRGAASRLERIAFDRFPVPNAVPDPTTLIEAALDAVRQLQRTDTTVIDATSDLDWASLQQALGLFVLNGGLTKVDEDHVAVILALGIQPMSWAEASGVTVDARAVGLARGARA